MHRNKLVVLLSIYFFIILLYSIFSYSLTDPNLVLSRFEPYWQFQTWMWRTFFDNSYLLANTYLILILALFGTFSWPLLDTSLQKLLAFVPTKKTFFMYLLIISPLLFSYNALSHDVFNYIFNAKMVVVYQADPHQKTALDFAFIDDWTRFMHNTHTPAPYGYGWTAISLLPYIAGFGKFFLIWLSFRLVEVAAIWLLYVVLQKLSWLIRNRDLTVSELIPVFLNPLFLIEVISNSHNDLWMLIPAMAAIILAASSHKYVNSTVKWLGVFILLSVSISIKYATIVLVPVIGMVTTGKYLLENLVMRKIPRFAMSTQITSKINHFLDGLWLPFIPLISSVLLFLPLLIPRSQLFHPWYLLWSLVWLPLIKQRWWKKFILLFSFTSMLRYLPWLYEGGFNDQTLFYQQLITFSAVILFFLRSKRSRSELM